MLVYYDVLSDREIASDSFESTFPVPGIRAIQSKKILVQEAEVDIGANASAEATEEDESVDASEAQTVINVVHAAHLQKVSLDKKEYKSMQKNYWKKLLEKLKTNLLKSLDFKSDYEPPEDKAEAKAAEDAAYNELSTYDRKAVDVIRAQMASFKEHFTSINNFVNDEIIANYDEFEFYLAEEAELGDAMIVPARYVGEAPAPVFYLFTDGIREKKE